MATTYQFRGDYINGQFVPIDREDESWAIKSPADLSETVAQVQARYENIDRAITSARRAFDKWKWLPINERIQLLQRLKENYLANADKFAECISRETGKPLWETKTEAKALADKIDITINHSMRLVAAQKIENALPGVDGYVRFKPRGVMAVLGPFNFPVHLPNGHIIPSLLMGNTVVFKPSDKTPMSAQLMAEMYHASGFPEGVFNLVQGRGETGKRLAGHEGVDGVLFTGSYDVGLKIKQDTLTHHWKILALEMGGKNHSIIWDDVDLKKAVYENLVGCFMTSGQRCACTSKILVHKNIKDKFLSAFYEAAKKITVGYWKENPFMGPLISAEAVEKYLRFQEIAVREGAESMMRGKALKKDKEGYYVTPSIHVVEKHDPKSVYQKSEIFGPNVAVVEIEDFDQAIEIVNSSGYGLVASLFTQKKEFYDKALIDVQVGLLNWNRTTNGASSKLPFGGMGKSGNDRPSGDFAIQYCGVPVASLEDKTAFDETKMLPGISL